MAVWTYSEKTKRYRDPKTGRFLPLAKVRSLRGTYLDAKRGQVDALSDALANGDTSLRAWVVTMRAVLKETWGVQYALGRGGRYAMKASDWGALGQMTREQYGYLQDYARSLAQGELSQAQMKARSGLYVNASSHGFERGQTASYRGLELPGHPADGGTVCLMNCRCHWEIAETRTHWSAVWTLGAAEHCRDCVKRAHDWNPYTQTKAQEKRQHDIRSNGSGSGALHDAGVHGSPA